MVSLEEKDQAYIWHPFTQMQTEEKPLLFTKGKGSYLYTEKGVPYLDGIASWWVNLHGHAHPYIAKKIFEQAIQLEHTLFAGFTHSPAVHLAERLLDLLPGPMAKIFFSDNGSTAVEAAIKMALQFWYNADPKTKRKKIICFESSYHGDTFGSMSVSGKNCFNRPFWSHLFEVVVIPPPITGKEQLSFSSLEKAISSGDVAGFIFEPLVMGVAGMVNYPARNLDHLIDLCNREEVITIADEVMTGFGRTKTLFACEQLKNKPDILCLSKGITGGFLPMGVTCCKKYIYNAFLSDEKEKALLHGHSYTANPLACASALASLDLLLSPACDQKREKIIKAHHLFCEKWRSHPKLKRCEVNGTILVLEYHDQKSSYFSSLRDRLYQFFLSRKIILRPLGNVLYLLPPYCITSEELEEIYQNIICTLENKL